MKKRQGADQYAQYAAVCIESEQVHTFMLYMNRARVKDIQTRVKDMHNTDCSGKKARQKTFIPHIPLQNRQFK